ncbi:MAG: hypothetical protein JK586_07400 [Nocardiopsis sp. BM-2018]|nr:MAG: hypothetical protein JK586_07400 [Nocardiopsis sp. BM-2018]
MFLTPRGGVVEALLVLERESGRRERETLSLAAEDARTAATLLGRVLARRDDLRSVARCRLRLAGPAAMRDEPSLQRLLGEAFHAERRRRDAA